jgi:hypothetical protein
METFEVFRYAPQYGSSSRLRAVDLRSVAALVRLKKRSLPRRRRLFHAGGLRSAQSKRGSGLALGWIIAVSSEAAVWRGPAVAPRIVKAPVKVVDRKGRPVPPAGTFRLMDGGPMIWGRS